LALAVVHAAMVARERADRNFSSMFSAAVIMRGMKLHISMRTTLWIVALVAILTGWIADRYRMEMRHQQDAAELARVKAHKRALQLELGALQVQRMQENMARRAELSRSQ
jgi:hypothetical protein